MSRLFANIGCVGWRGAAIVVSALLAGCSVAGSSALQIGEPAGCTSDLGTYFLPKHHVTIAIKRAQQLPDKWITDKDGRPVYELVKFHKVADSLSLRDDPQTPTWRSINVEVQPDPEFGFCLDYAAIPTAKDRLIVERNAKTGLLTQVATRGKFYENPAAGGDNFSTPTDDSKSASESEKIASRIVQATFTGLARRRVRSCKDADQFNRPPQAYCDCESKNPTNKYACMSLGYAETSRVPADGTPFEPTHRGEFADLEKAELLAAEKDRNIEDRTDIAFNVDFDPTDPVETARVNRELAAFGFCAFLGDGKVDLKQAAEYCRNPEGYAQARGFRPRSTPAGAAKPGSLPFRPYGGVLYRARVSYPFYVFKYERRGWLLHEQEEVKLANRGPIVSVGIDRAFFATRNTKLDFKDGTLSSVDIERGSELKAFAGIPLALVTSIVNLPRQVLLLKIEQTTDTAELINVNKAIIEAQVAYNGALSKLKDAEAAPRTVTGADADPDRRSKLLNACESVLTTRGGAANRTLDTCRQIVDQSYNR